MCSTVCWISIYYVNLGLRGRIIPPAESCNWNGFIDIKASQWKIGLYTGRAGGDRIFEYLNLNNKMQRNFSYNHFDRHATKFSDISDLINLQMNFPKFPV